ncbi:His-Xaa-Ser system radical SAM maturase HxsB [Patescibacteria group bacterium]|nr:His-Xaa-Ser system radical SAM maturase HxsB [Patescibacteria group bacterium]
MTKTGFFRFKKIGPKYLLTNDVGDFIFLKDKDFKDFQQGKLKNNNPTYQELDQKHFTSQSWNCENCQQRLINRYAQRREYLNQGPGLHIVVVTLRCDHACRYCHASSKSMKRFDLDMTESTAEKVVDRIFETTSPDINVEFQGGEPLANFGIVKFIVNRVLEKNKKAKKRLRFSLVSTLTLLDDKKLDWLHHKKVSLCSSLDGPENLHNKNRPMLSGENGYRKTTEGIRKAKNKYRDLRYQINALPTITRDSLNFPKQIVDEYVKLGLRDIHLRWLNPFGMAKSLQKVIGYGAKDFVDFYRKALDHIIALNLKGRDVRERMAKIVTQKAFTDEDPNFLDLRSPCGAGIGQLAYHYNGDVYTCDEGRMLGQMGDETFKLGNVHQNSYGEIISSPVTKSLCVTSTLDGLTGCSQCVFLPYCGVCPVFNYSEQGNIFTQAPNNFRCQVQKGILEYLFQKFQDQETLKIFKKWIRR